MSTEEELLLWGDAACALVERKKNNENCGLKTGFENEQNIAHTYVLTELKLHPKVWHNYLGIDEETSLKLMLLVFQCDGLNRADAMM